MTRIEYQNTNRVAQEVCYRNTPHQIQSCALYHPSSGIYDITVVYVVFPPPYKIN